jgi:two-component system sensor histidine kinase KdpD
MVSRGSIRVGIQTADRGAETHREARMVGLGDVRTPSLEAVERRRLQLWALTAGLIVALAIGAVVMSLLPGETTDLVSLPVLRVSVILLSMAYGLYVIDKELHLRRLSKMLLEERVLSATLSDRLREVTLLLEAGRALNAELDLTAVLRTMLRSALELLAVDSGSVMLLDGEELVSATSVGNDAAVSARRRVGEGIAGRVAATREALLINGTVDPPDAPERDEGVEAPGSAICVPLINRDELLGVLNVSSRAPGRFTEFDLRAMSVFGEQAAAAIANARLYETERTHVAQLRRLNNVKSEFLARVSHELRTPLTSIIGAVAAIRGADDAEDRDALEEIVERQARRLAGMVDELLAASRFEHDGIRSHAEDFDLATIVRQAAGDARVAGREVAVDAPERCRVIADPELFRRAIDNLIDNAYKHGAPPVHVSLAERADEVVVEVRDHGRGIPEDQREAVFERFHRVNDETPGLGLGLALVRDVARASGGVVEIDDAPGGGTTFRLRWPSQVSATANR